MKRLSDPSGGPRPFRPREPTERGGRGGLTQCRVTSVDGGEGGWSRGLEANANGAAIPVTATGRGCLAQSGRVAQKWPDSTAQGSAAPGGPRRPLRTCRQDLRVTPTTGSGPGLPRPGRARSGGRPTEHGGATPLPRGSRLLTGDVQEAQPLGLQGRPRGQRLPVPLHSRRRSARTSSVSLSLRPPARPYVYVARRGRCFGGPATLGQSLRGRAGVGVVGAGRAAVGAWAEPLSWPGAG